MKHGCKALHLVAPALGMAGQMFDKAPHDRTHHEVTSPWRGLTFGQSQGYRLMREKGTQPLEAWFLEKRDISYGIQLTIKKHRCKSHPKSPHVFLCTMGEAFPRAPQPSWGVFIQPCSSTRQKSWWPLWQNTSMSPPSRSSRPWQSVTWCRSTWTRLYSLVTGSKERLTRAWRVLRVGNLGLNTRSKGCCQSWYE
jgi:hypothetical protein